MGKLHGYPMDSLFTGGGMSDPFQPDEVRYRYSFECLKVLGKDKVSGDYLYKRRADHYTRIP